MLIVSLTTIPPRSHDIFKKLFIFHQNQTLKPDKIILNICNKYTRFDDVINIDNADQYLSYLLCNNILHINYTDDYGALTKLYPTIKYLQQTYTDQFIDIITIDDDCLYIDDLIEILYNTAIKMNKVAVLGFFGFNLNGNDIGEALQPCTENHMKPCDVIGGVNGIYYNLSFFKENEEYEKYINNLSFADYLCDDEVTNMYIRHKKIDRIIINKQTFKSIDPSAYGDYALHKNNVRERQLSTIKNCIKVLSNL
jgi:hypothetical protein